MGHNTDDLYATYSDDGTVRHGDCAERKWPGGLPDSVTPVFYGDAWRAEVAGICAECGRYVGRPGGRLSDDQGIPG